MPYSLIGLTFLAYKLFIIIMDVTKHAWYVTNETWLPCTHVGTRILRSVIERPVSFYLRITCMYTGLIEHLTAHAAVQYSTLL